MLPPSRPFEAVHIHTRAHHRYARACISGRLIWTCCVVKRAGRLASSIHGCLFVAQNCLRVYYFAERQMRVDVGRFPQFGGSLAFFIPGVSFLSLSGAVSSFPSVLT